MRDEPSIEHWSDELEQAIERCAECVVDRVVVLTETSSTQDAALRAFDGTHGVAAIAKRQTSGRGQRGNRWDDGDGDTLAISFAMPSSGLDPQRLAAAGGLAAFDSVRAVCQSTSELMLKWPNDVIVRTDDADRKIAGVLVEIRDGAAVIGIGINTRARVWDSLQAVSIEQLAGDINRVTLASALIDRLSLWMNATDQLIQDSWRTHDAMIGTERVFVIDNESVSGEVLAVDPLGTIRLRTESCERELDVRVTRNA